MDFTICGHVETVSEDEVRAHSIHKHFEKRAQLASEKIREKYENYQDWKTFVLSAPKDGYGIIANEVELCIPTLVRSGKYGASSDSFYEKYGQLILEPWDQLIDEICNLTEQTRDLEEQARYARELRKASRGHVVGGGFGVSGALKGMAFAGAANMATGAAHSFANAIGNAKTRNEIARHEAELYQNEEFKKTVCERIYFAVERIAGCLLVELGIDANDVQPRDSLMAANLLKNYSMVPQEDRLEVLIHALNCDRYNAKIYEYLLLEFDDTEDVVKIGRLFSLDKEMNSLCARALWRILPLKSQLSSMNLSEKEEALKQYRQKRESLSFKDEISGEHELESAIIEEFVPTGWRGIKPKDIPDVLNKIKQTKQKYDFQSQFEIEQELKKQLKNAKTVNGKEYSTLEEAEKFRNLRSQLQDLCRDISGKNYEELTALLERIHKDSEQDPTIYGKDIIDNLQKEINRADINRRTYLGFLFQTAEDVLVAKDIRRESDNLMAKCNWESGESVESTQRQLLLLKERLKPCCIEDYIAQVETAHRQLCTYHGVAFSTFAERIQVEHDYLTLENRHLISLENQSVSRINEIRKMVSGDGTLHQAAKEMFDKVCLQQIDQVQQAEKEADISRVQEELKTKYSSLDLSDHSRKNFERLNQAANELKQYDTEYTKSILQPIESAINDSRTLYDRESTLLRDIKYAKSNSNPAKILKDIVINFLKSTVAAMVALLLIPIWWLKLLIFIGAIVMFFQESGNSFKDSRANNERAKKLQEELEEIRQRIGDRTSKR